LLSKHENRLITEVEESSPAGTVLRSYWQPAALVEEISNERPVIPVKLFGEELVLFRDEQGNYGLLDRHCSHRGADLCFGRLEDGGIRCAFHGWLFDASGNCLEQPAEPVDSSFRERLKHPAYPCVEKNGIVFAWMGEGEPPLLQRLDCFLAPDTNTFAFKGLMECNWLQALEVGIDPAHASFLHRFFEDEDTDESYGKQFRAGAAGTDIPLTKLLREYERPVISTEDTGYGFRIITTRNIDTDTVHYRITNLLFPNAIVIPMNDYMTITQWHVPVDDENCYWYALFTSFSGPVDKELMRRQRLELYTLPGYRPRRNKSNNYGFDPAEQKQQTYTGMGMDINVHDQWAVESLGRIQDRTREHLGKSDVAIIKYRRILKGAIKMVEEGTALPFLNEELMGGPVALDALGSRRDVDCWKDMDRRRRASSDWAPDPW
jgi:phenylpropionate dioxygenase-like ring-hydroxylating dioxygenase large terminal subunit